MSFLKISLRRKTAGRLSRAATAREGRAITKPVSADSPLPALDSATTSKIGAVGGQDGLRKPSRHCFGQSCPQPSGSKALGKAGRQLEPSEAVGRQNGRRNASAYGARTTASAATHYTDRWVEI